MWVLEKALPADPMILLGDINAHVGHERETWKGVIGWKGLSDGLPLGFCASHGLATRKTMLEHKVANVLLVCIGTHRELCAKS